METMKESFSKCLIGRRAVICNGNYRGRIGDITDIYIRDGKMPSDPPRVLALVQGYEVNGKTGNTHVVWGLCDIETITLVDEET